MRLQMPTPRAPEGVGPALAWHRPIIGAGWARFIGYFVFFMIAMSVITALSGGSPLLWVQWWQIWLIILVFSLLSSRPTQVDTQAAGADWYQWSKPLPWWNLRRNDKGMIRIYDLTEVTVESRDERVFFGLEDKEGNLCERERDQLQKNRKIWDLIYNGILHSVANGARINDLAVTVLGIDQTDALALREANLRNGMAPNQPGERTRGGRHSS